MKIVRKTILSLILSVSLIKVPEADNLGAYEVGYTELMGTVYNAEAKQCNADYLTTADMSKINLKKLKDKEIRWVALSRDLLSRWGGKFNYGDSIYIHGGEKEGWWVVHDCMNKRYKNSIDFLEYKQKRFKEKVKILSIRKHGRVYQRKRNTET
jgi:3D (Asp-Asp-Asp) domain-containing protein